MNPNVLKNVTFCLSTDIKIIVEKRDVNNYIFSLALSTHSAYCAGEKLSIAHKSDRTADILCDDISALSVREGQIIGTTPDSADMIVTTIDRYKISVTCLKDVQPGVLYIDGKSFLLNQAIDICSNYAIKVVLPGSNIRQLINACRPLKASIYLLVYNGVDCAAVLELLPYIAGVVLATTASHIDRYIQKLTDLNDLHLSRLHGNKLTTYNDSVVPAASNKPIIANIVDTVSFIIKCYEVKQLVLGDCSPMLRNIITFNFPLLTYDSHGQTTQIKIMGTLNELQWMIVH